ncbi:hypothetical protein O1611_g1929 [Lasiodiplodia mahajangana]|uniref:Uncharacterized protein n=1 Tax=Lasiodiplodia mahajangana TaxID=1108764 RepID=A0ACC2JWP6_9PEZI|nr:hypothetical protein O1611_g1929 [Lasiodiplodia mahajangana]
MLIASIITSGIMLAVSALTLNGTASNSTWIELEADKNKPIPITDVRCMHLTVLEDYAAVAKKRMIEWGESGHKVRPGSHVVKFFPENSTDSMAWIVCNMKLFGRDPLPRNELNQAEDEIISQCGRMESGRVFSRKWNKEYIMAPHSWYFKALWKGGGVCRHG